MDITNFMTWFINLFVDLLKFVFNTLDSITFNGTSLLRYSIFVVLIIPIMTILFTLVSNRNVYRNIKNDIKTRKDNSDNEEN